MRNNPFLIKNGFFDPMIVIDDYCEFSHKQRSEVIKKIKRSIPIAARVWRKTVGPDRTLKELSIFYANPDYIYDLLDAFYNYRKSNKIATCVDAVEFVKKNSGGKVLEFGGGTGQLCLLLYFNTNKKISYFDLPGSTMDFARWRFKKYRAKIKIIVGKVNAFDIAWAPYDVIISDATLEHVPDLPATIRLLKKSLAPKGFLYLLFDEDPSCDRPMHLNKITDFYRILKNESLMRVDCFVWTNSSLFRDKLQSIIFNLKNDFLSFIRLLRKNLGLLKNKMKSRENGNSR